MQELKITLIGAGSSFGWQTIVDLAHAEEIHGNVGKLVLVDLSEEILNEVKTFAETVFDKHGLKAEIETYTDRREALKGSDYVIIMVAENRFELWEQDFRVPLAYGFKHPLGENGGPGALFHTLRSYRLIEPIFNDIQDVCPDAFLFNFSNPESRVVLFWKSLYNEVSGVGLCHGVISALGKISAVLERPVEDIRVTPAGINHFFWIQEIQDRETEEDLYPEFKKRIEENPDTLSPLVQAMMDTCGLFTYPSDGHIGEYLAFAAEFTGLKWPYGKESRPVPADSSKSRTRKNRVKMVNSGELDPLELTSSSEILVDIIADIELDRGEWRPAVNVLNDELYVSNLPEDAAVEVSCVVDKNGVNPLKTGELPEVLAAFSRLQISIQKLILKGYIEKNRRPLLQALLLDPFTNSFKACEKLLDDMLKIQEDYLPEIK